MSASKIIELENQVRACLQFAASYEWIYGNCVEPDRGGSIWRRGESKCGQTSMPVLQFASHSGIYDVGFKVNILTPKLVIEDCTCAWLVDSTAGFTDFGNANLVSVTQKKIENYLVQYGHIHQSALI